MGRLDEYDWWWNVAFSSIASTLIGAAIAIGGVWWTLKHSRVLAAAAIDAEREQRAEEQVVQSCLRLLDATEDVLREVDGEPYTFTHFDRWRLEILALRNQAIETEPHLMEYLDACANSVRRPYSNTPHDAAVGIFNTAHAMRSTIRARLVKPRMLESYEGDNWDFLLGQARAGNIPTIG